MAGTSSISGVISGIKSDEIIAKLQELGKKPITRLEGNKTTLKAKITAWQDINTRVKALGDAAKTMAKTSSFDLKSVTSSDTDIATATVSPTAQAGSYFIKVKSLATTDQKILNGYADTNTAVGTGTINITVGTGTTKSIVIDSNNNTLSGIRDAINRADAGVTAVIINDGDATKPYRLIITSNKSGTAGKFEFDTTAFTSTGTSVFTKANLQVGTDAEISIGDSDNPLIIKSSSNTVTSVIPGVTLDLKSADANKLITIKVDNDTSAIRENVKKFVDQYNNLAEYINLQNTYNTTTNTSGTLFGDSAINKILSDMQSNMQNPVSDLSQTTKMLSQLGITSDQKGLLTINYTDLDKALKDNLKEVKHLFSSMGESTNASVSYLSSTSKTKVSGTDGYAVFITQAATQSHLTAGVAQTQSLTADETLTINTVSIKLTAGMTQAEVIKTINERSNATGIIASATSSDGSGTGNYLTLKAVGYGTAGPVSVISTKSNGGSTPVADTSGFGTTAVDMKNVGGETGTGTGVIGLDVAGTINGEAATGQGQMLKGNEKNEKTEGLSLLITAATTGDFGKIVFSKGLGGIMSDFTDKVSDVDTGAVDSSTDTLNAEITAIDKKIADMQKLMDVQQARLESQFAAMESALSKLQSQGQYITNMLSSSK